MIWALIAVLLGGIAVAAVAGAQRNPDAGNVANITAAKPALPQLPVGSGKVVPGVAHYQQPAGPLPQMPTGIFPMSDGAPAAIPMRLFHLTDRAQLMIGNVYTIVYAGALANNPQQGVFAVYQENLVTGAQSQHQYLAPHADGALTITAMHATVLSFTSTSGHGTFDVAAGRFAG